MTEKRFELKWRDTGEVLYDNETGLEHRIYSPNYRFHVRDMMNKLHEEKEMWKGECKRLKGLYYLENENVKLEDIIGLVKTDEPTNSVELKKELYK